MLKNIEIESLQSLARELGLERATHPELGSKFQESLNSFWLTFHSNINRQHNRIYIRITSSEISMFSFKDTRKKTISSPPQIHSGFSQKGN